MAPNRQLSTAIASFVLSLISFHAACRLFDTLPAAFAFLLFAIAESAGVLHHAVFPENNTLSSIYDYFSWLTSVLSCPCFAMTFFKNEEMTRVSHFFLAFGIASVLVSSTKDNSSKDQLAKIVSTLSIVSIFMLSIYKFKPYAVIGTLLYSLAGVAVGRKGCFEQFNLPRIDIFKYIQCIANLSIMLSLLSRTTLVYYRPTKMSL